MTDTRWTQEDLVAAARHAIGKIDDAGVRGITLCSMVEIEALAIVAATSPLLARPAAQQASEENDHG